MEIVIYSEMLNGYKNTGLDLDLERCYINSSGR